jgi:hypothetical protein
MGSGITCPAGITAAVPLCLEHEKDVAFVAQAHELIAGRMLSVMTPVPPRIQKNPGQRQCHRTIAVAEIIEDKFVIVNFYMPHAIWTCVRAVGAHPGIIERVMPKDGARITVKSVTLSTHENRSPRRRNWLRRSRPLHPSWNWLTTIVSLILSSHLS